MKTSHKVIIALIVLALLYYLYMNGYFATTSPAPTPLVPGTVPPDTSGIDTGGLGNTSGVSGAGVGGQPLPGTVSISPTALTPQQIQVQAQAQQANALLRAQTKPTTTLRAQAVDVNGKPVTNPTKGPTVAQYRASGNSVASIIPISAGSADHSAPVVIASVHQNPFAYHSAITSGLKH